MNKIKCWELSRCSEADCPVHGDPEQLCWHETKTLCPGLEGPEPKQKLEVCLGCEIFREVLKGGSLAESVSHFLALLKQKVAEGDPFLEELALGLSQVYLVLARLSIGDATVRVPTGAETDLLYSLRQLLNRHAQGTQEMVTHSHEMAVGLGEHYETLKRIASGDFSARAMEASENLLVAKLGQLINAEASALTGCIAELERAKESLKDQYHFLQVLSDTIPSPVFSKDAAGRYIGCNDAFLSFIGYTREQVLGKTVHELWPKELADQYHLRDLELFQSGEPQAYEARVTYADGTLHDVIINKALFRNQDGSLGGMVAVFLDITERKAAEERTRNAYHRIADILEFLPDATFVVDREKRVIAWNRAIEEMTGVKKEAILGQGDHAYALAFYGERREILIDLLDKDHEYLDRYYTDVDRKGGTLTAVARIPRFRGGNERFFRNTAAPLYDCRGSWWGGSRPCATSPI